MRSAPLKVPADSPVGYYHCLSRLVDRQFILHEAEKDHFVSLMQEYEAFCEVDVPKRPEVLPTAEEVIAKLKQRTGEHFVGMFEQQVA